MTVGKRNITIGKNIRKWRTFHDIKQETFAKQLGISRVMLSRYENGRTGVPDETLKKICVIFNIDLVILTAD